MSSAMPGVDDAFLIAQTLNPADKLELISRLWDDVRQSGTFRPSDKDLAEVKRRWAELESGAVVAVPWEEVRDKIRRRLDTHE